MALWRMSRRGQLRSLFIPRLRGLPRRIGSRSGPRYLYLTVPVPWDQLTAPSIMTKAHNRHSKKNLLSRHRFYLCHHHLRPIPPRALVLLSPGQRWTGSDLSQSS